MNKYKQEMKAVMNYYNENDCRCTIKVDHDSQYPIRITGKELIDESKVSLDTEEDRSYHPTIVFDNSTNKFKYAYAGIFDGILEVGEPVTELNNRLN